MTPPDDLLALHRALLVGEPTAPNAFAGAVFEALVRDVRRAVPWAEPADAEDAVVDAVWDHIREPGRCQATNAAGVWAYLRQSAANRARTALRGARRRQERDARWGDRVAEDAMRADVELSGPAASLERAEEREALDVRREEVLAALADATDRRLLELRLSGERRTSAFAEVLGITHLPTDEQTRHVKRHKDRIDKIVRRARERSTDVPGGHRVAGDAAPDGERP